MAVKLQSRTSTLLDWLNLVVPKLMTRRILLLPSEISSFDNLLTFTTLSHPATNQSGREQIKQCFLPSLSNHPIVVISDLWRFKGSWTLPNILVGKQDEFMGYRELYFVWYSAALCSLTFSNPPTLRWQSVHCNSF
jgi:hypothetical protein